MAGKTNWTALRDEWINRRLNGETLSKTAFFDEKALDLNRTYFRKQTASWTAVLAEREAAISAEVNTATDKTQRQHRKDLQTLADQGMRPIIDACLGVWKLGAELQAEKLKKRLLAGEDVDLNKEMPLRDLCTLVEKYEKVKVVGAGMPKEHVHLHEEVPEGLRVGREQMKGLEEAAVGLARWWERERDGPGPPKKS